MRRTYITTISLTGALLVSACASPDQMAKLSNSRAGFDTVASTASAATGKQTVWLQSSAEAAANAKRVQALVYKKTISADTAVQVALLNNKGLQAAYADLGLSSADVWQQTLQPNPTVSVGVLGIGATGLAAGLPDRWSRRDGHQPRRKHHPTHYPEPQERALCRPRRGRPHLGAHGIADQNLQIEQHRSIRLSACHN